MSNRQRDLVNSISYKTHSFRKENTKKWKYQLCSLSKQLRAAINNVNGTQDSYNKILEVLKTCYEKIKNFVDIIEWWDIKTAYDTLINDIDILRSEYESDCSSQLKKAGYREDNPVLECINTHLHKFYIICHDHSIWISTPFDLRLE